MAPSYEDYLAAQVLSENRIVTYRLLSRALQVHVNSAKEMLYDFYHAQNARKPASLHATYLLTGTRAPPTNGTRRDTDTVMTDSFAASSPLTQEPPADGEPQPVRTTTITLCREEDLPAVRASYVTLESIHIYSLEPGPISTLTTLTECTLRTAAASASHDPLTSWQTHGTIHNPRAQRRNTRAPPNPVAPPTTSKPAPKPAAAPKPADSATTATSKPAPITSKPAPKSKSQAPSLFASFQKQATKSTKDTPMRDAPDEGSDTEAPAADPVAEARAAAAREERAARETQLRAMMDEPSDDDMHDTSGASEAEEHEEEEEEEAPPEPIPTPPTSAPEPPPASVVTVNGRRRGRRRVTKKKTTRDAEGYLVTREEAVWESFSEDDAPAPPPPKAAPKQEAKDDAEPAAKKAKGAGGTAKKGQGNLLNFFGKK